MFSGKSDEMMRRIRRYAHANKRCILIKPKMDDRYDENGDGYVYTHYGLKMAAVVCDFLEEADLAFLWSGIGFWYFLHE